MGKNYTRRTNRSRRKSPPSLRGKILGIDQASVQLSLPIVEILSGLNDTVEAVAAEAGLLVMKALIDEEVERHAGTRYRHDADRQAVRWGQEDGYVVFAGRKVPIERPRVRGAHGQEVPLERYRLLQANGRLQRAVRQRVVCGVSTRDYQRVIDDVCDGYGIERSSVSRHWKAVSVKQMAELMERPLGGLDLVALVIDGIEFHKYLLVVALGIDTSGRKHVLGLWPGATENAQVCKELLEDLVGRGMATDRKYLFVLDGSKALKKAVESCFGKQAEIQRCQVHKERNVLAHLPPSHHTAARRRLRAAWGMKSYAEARDALLKTVKYLEDLNASAAASLEEGLQETLTLHRLGVPEVLRRTLRSTNVIESCFARTRKLCGNVKRWGSEEMSRRWAGAILLECQRCFHRVKGYREMVVLIQALRVTESKEAAA